MVWNDRQGMQLLYALPSPREDLELRLGRRTEEPTEAQNSKVRNIDDNVVDMLLRRARVGRR